VPESETQTSSRASAKGPQRPRQRTISTEPAPALSVSEALGHEESPLKLTLLRSDFSQSAFDQHAALLGDPRLSHPANARQRSQILQHLQRDYGNQYVQQLAKHIMRAKASQANGATVGPPSVQIGIKENHPAINRATAPTKEREIETEEPATETLPGPIREETTAAPAEAVVRPAAVDAEVPQAPAAGPTQETKTGGPGSSKVPTTPEATVEESTGAPSATAPQAGAPAQLGPGELDQHRPGQYLLLRLRPARRPPKKWPPLKER
jgi:hypothetical protein